MHGQFVWYELSTPDVDAAQKFYPRFTGWRTQAFDEDYTMWTTGGVPIAGLFRLTDEMRQQGIPPNWLPYVEASNVDETVAKAQSLGGRVVHGPAEVPGAGRFAVVADPQGAVFGVYKSSNANSGAWDGTAVAGRFSWHELMTTDHVNAFEFYRALFGWETWGEPMDMGGGNMYAMYGKDGKGYGGMFNRPAEMGNMHPFWLVYIHVPDVGKAVASAVKAGAAIHRPQMDIPGGSIAILGDPQGAGFALHHVTVQPAAARQAAKTAPKKAAKKAAKKAVKKAAKKAAKKPARKPAAKKAARKAVKTATKKAATKTKAKGRTTAKRRRR
ncbi:MAG TPA: VOC family protein [Gemmatimonadaceae bacterium]|nr:VOC family protein [Gemmatimonadaceae bacterium]